MNFEWSDTQHDIIALTDKIARAEVSEASLREVDLAGTFFHERVYRKLGETGLLGVAIPEAQGGAGGSASDLCALLYVLGRHVVPTPAWASLALGALPVARFGSEALRSRVLAGVVEGRRLLTGAFEEPGTFQPEAPHTHAQRRGGDLHVSGRKVCVPFAQRAHRIVTAVRVEQGVALVLVDPEAAGVRFQAGVATDGAPVFRVDLDRVRVAAEDVLIEGEPARHALRDAVQHATVAACAMALGMCEEALRITARYVSERKQFGVPIGSFQAVRQRAADAYIDVEAMRISAQQAMFLLDEGRDATLACAVAKHHAAEAGYRVAYAAQHLHGGMGYDVDYPLHRYYRWAKAIELTLGSAPEQLGIIGNVLAERAVRIGD